MNSQGKSFQERLAEAEERWKNATISDIIAAKRREADSIEQSARGTFKVGYSWDDLPFTEGNLERELDNAARIRKEADCLEAALKREKSAIEADALAVGGIVGASRAIAEKSSEVGDAAKLREALEHLDKLAREFAVGNYYVSDFPKMLRDVIQAALAAPPRNCDRPECATTKAAQDVWRREDGGKTAYYEWLLAPATKEEGGSK